jgi:hypothetical protein
MIITVHQHASYIAGEHTNRASLCSWTPAQPRSYSSGREGPAQDSQLIPFRDHHWTQTTHHGVGADLRFPCDYFKRWFMANKRYWVCVCVCTLLGGTVCICGRFLTRFSYLQVFTVQCTWLRLGEAWCRLGVPETLLHSHEIHLQALWTGLEWVWCISQKSSFMFHAVSMKGRFTSPEMMPKGLLTWKWVAWGPKTWPCTTVEDARWWECSVSPDSNIPAVEVITSTWQSGHTKARICPSAGAKEG